MSYLYGTLFIVGIIVLIVMLLTDKTSPFYNSSLANGVVLSTLYPNNALYHQYQSQETAEKEAKLLMSLYNDPQKTNDCIQIYRRNNGQVILVDHKNRLASTSKFFFDSHALNIDSYTYHPEETVYTGVTVRGFHVGGTHTNPAYYTESKSFSGQAQVVLNYSKNLPFFRVSCVRLSPALAEKAQNTSVVKSYLSKDILKLYGAGLDLYNLLNKSTEPAYIESLKNGNIYSAAKEKSQFEAIYHGIPIGICKTIASWLTNVTK